MQWLFFGEIHFNIEAFLDGVLSGRFLTDTYERERKWERSKEERSGEKKQEKVTWMTLERLNDVPEDIAHGK